MNMRLILTLIVLCASVSAPPTYVEEFSAKVIGVTDGDTITVLQDRKQIKIRLEGIDAPERDQAFGTKSKSSLSDLVGGKTVIVRKTGTDKYRRTLARIVIDRKDVSAEMLTLGMAWHYKEYSKDEDLARLETVAKVAKIGLWAEANVLPPWEYRSRQKSAPQPVASTSSSETPTTGSHWLNTNGGTRHNARCQYFKNTKKGRLCGPTEGKPCGKCGG